jgi:hypothetical protein
MHKTLQALGKMAKDGDIKSAKVKTKISIKAPKKVSK